MESERLSGFKNNLQQEITIEKCLHCQKPFSRVSVFDQFCCRGCESVYRWIHDLKLDHYYSIRDKNRRQSDNQIELEIDLSQKDRLLRIFNQKDTIRSKMVQDGSAYHLWLYLEGIHCTACIWLLERLPEKCSEILDIQVDSWSHEARITVANPDHFKTAAEWILNLGYTPHLVEPGEQKKLIKKENKVFLTRIAVAGFCASNIMLLSISVYAGAEEPFRVLFQWISVILFLPVLFFSAIPFFKSSWKSLRTGLSSIDTPIALALSVGFISSLFGLIVEPKTAHVYFDSLSVFVFLILGTRFLLKRFQERLQSNVGLIQTLVSKVALRVRKISVTGKFETTEESVSPAKLQPQEWVEVQKNETLPCDGRIITGSSYLDCSLLTGESKPVPVRSGTFVYAGSLNLGEPLTVEITSHFEDSRLNQMIRSIEKSAFKKNQTWKEISDRVIPHFIQAILILGVIAFGWGFFKVGFFQGIQNLLAISVVMCPCALGLASPLAILSGVSLAARMGIVIKRPETLEVLSNIENIFLDKTGTLTYGNFRVLSDFRDAEYENRIPKIVYLLEKESRHPIGSTLFSEMKKELNQDVIRDSVEDLCEVSGQGVSGRINSKLYRVGKSQSLRPSYESQVSTQVGVYVALDDSENPKEKQIAHFILGDEIRPEAKEMIEQLQEIGKEVFLLTGDRKENANVIARTVGIKKSHLFSDQLPEGKSQTIRSASQSMMVGDGANDALALSQATVGVAFGAAIDMSLKASDVFIKKSGLKKIVYLLLIGSETAKVIHRNIAFSLIYNVFGVFLVFFGWIHPLVAATLMPISALSVFLSSIFGTKKLRNFRSRVEI